MHEGSKSVRSSPSREKAQAEINDNDADEDEDDDDDDDDKDGTSRQCTETHALLVTSAQASDLVYPSTTSTPSSSPTTLPKLRRQQPRSSEDREKNENSTRKSSTEAIQEAAAFLYSEYSGEVKRRKRKPRARQRKVIGDLKDFYEKHLEASKDLTEGIFLSTSEVCDICARRADSPVYSDRFVYNQQPLLAREVTLLQTARGHAVFIPTSKLDEDVDFMPIYQLTKSNASGIFYSTGMSSEDVDLKSNLEPSIVLLDSPRSFHTVESDGPPFYRQFLDKGYSRISQKGTTEQIAPFKDKEDFRIDMESNVEEQSWLGEVTKKERAVDLERNRSSLLMLEPLLLMPSETTSRGLNYKKKRLAHSEHLKLVRIVIAYSLTFVILVSITYYVVYFT